MIKITLPSGVTIEADNLDEAVAVTTAIVHPPEPEIVVPEDFPHKVVEEMKRGVTKIGGREEQVLRVAKQIAESEKQRDAQFRSSDVAVLGEIDAGKVSGALVTLAAKGLVRQRQIADRMWIIQPKGWNSKFYIYQPLRGID